VDGSLRSYKSMYTSTGSILGFADKARITAKTDAADLKFYEAAELELALDKEQATRNRG
jgi:hypothetical protein